MKKIRSSGLPNQNTASSIQDSAGIPVSMTITARR